MPPPVAPAVALVEPPIVMPALPQPDRLGKQTGAKIRLIRVTCNIEQQVSDIVRNAGKLMNSRFKNKVFVATDRTPKQLAYFMELKDQLEERMDAGESDLKIRHFNGFRGSSRKTINAPAILIVYRQTHVLFITEIPETQEKKNSSNKLIGAP
nr:unnamed protein product [Callosobruchus chinensis]